MFTLEKCTIIVDAASRAYLLTTSKQYEETVDILGVWGVKNQYEETVDILGVWGVYCSLAALAGVPQSLTSTGAGCPWCVVLAWVTVFSSETKFPITKATRYLMAQFKQY